MPVVNFGLPQAVAHVQNAVVNQLWTDVLVQKVESVYVALIWHEFTLSHLSVAFGGSGSFALSVIHAFPTRELPRYSCRVHAKSDERLTDTVISRDLFDRQTHALGDHECFSRE